jgi:hypothetical protein
MGLAIIYGFEIGIEIKILKYFSVLNNKIL